MDTDAGAPSIPGGPRAATATANGAKSHSTVPSARVAPSHWLHIPPLPDNWIPDMAGFASPSGGAAVAPSGGAAASVTPPSGAAAVAPSNGAAASVTPPSGAAASVAPSNGPAASVTPPSGAAAVAPPNGAAAVAPLNGATTPVTPPSGATAVASSKGAAPSFVVVTKSTKTGKIIERWNTTLTHPQMLAAGFLKRMVSKAEASDVYKYIHRLSPTAPPNANLADDVAPYTHVVLHEGSYALLRLSLRADRGKKGQSVDSSHATFETKYAIKHLRDEYGIQSQASLESAKRNATAVAAAAGLEVVEGDGPKADKKKKIGPMDGFAKPDKKRMWAKVARQKAAQMLFYVYCSCAISLSTFNDPYFRGMLHEGDSQFAVMDRQSLQMWVNYEYELMLLYFEFMFETLVAYHGGNSFLQLIHDGTHLNNGKHYQARAREGERVK